MHSFFCDISRVVRCNLPQQRDSGGDRLHRPDSADSSEIARRVVSRSLGCCIDDTMRALKCLAIFALSTLGYAKLDLYPTESSYPFAIHEPASMVDAVPLLLFLHGAGAVGSASDLTSHVAYDGVGWMVSQYDGASKTTGSYADAAENYLWVEKLGEKGDSDLSSIFLYSVVLPLSPTGQCVSLVTAGDELRFSTLVPLLQARMGCYKTFHLD